MVSSLDGIIARPDNSVSWFEISDNYEKGVAAEISGQPDKTIDCYVMGSRTYEHALELSRDHGWVYGDTPTVVVTKRNLRIERDNVELYAGDLERLVSERLRPKYKNVWLVGGAALVKSFMRLKLADEIRLSILPIVLGGGRLFFDQVGMEQPLHLMDVMAYRNGMVELWYEVRK